MFTATLLCDPATPRADGAVVEALRNAWGGGAVHWLDHAIAAEFALPAMPANRWEAWSAFQTLGLDLIVQRTEGRRKALLLADMDSTMIGQECIDELADEAGVGERVAEITRRAMNGDLDFEAALRERVGLLRGLPESVIATVLERRITYTPGGHELIATMRAQGGYTALVSGGFVSFTRAVAAHLGFDENRANTLLVDGARLTGEVGEPILGRAAKVAALDEIAARLDITAERVIAVGDGANDLSMLARAGTGVAFRARPAVAAQCEVRVNHGDLTALLYIQGYARGDFAA